MVQLNACLAFFLHDLLSVMDRGYVFTLIRTYMKDLCSRSFDFILCDPVKMLNCSSLLMETFSLLPEFMEKEKQTSRQPSGVCRSTS